MGWRSTKIAEKLVDYANTTNVEFIVDPKVLFHGWLIYSYLQIFKLIKCKWLPGECADWFFDNIMTWSYSFHRRYSMSRQKNSILINKHALNHEPVPLKHYHAEIADLVVVFFLLLFLFLWWWGRGLGSEIEHFLSTKLMRPIFVTMEGLQSDAIFGLENLSRLK